MDLRGFLMEVLGSPVPRSSTINQINVTIAKAGTTDSTFADICQGNLTLPATSDKELFTALLSFRGPYYFNK